VKQVKKTAASMAELLAVQKLRLNAMYTFKNILCVVSPDEASKQALHECHGCG